MVFAVANTERTEQDLQAVGDDAAVTALGYKQRLDRTLGNFTIIAIQYSYMSVVNAVAVGSVFAGQMLVALIFCELAAQYAVALTSIVQGFCGLVTDCAGTRFRLWCLFIWRGWSRGGPGGARVRTGSDCAGPCLLSR